MSSIQILGTLPGYSTNMGDAPNEQNNDNATAGPTMVNPSFASFAETPGDWDLDLQDMSWLGRLPVYTDLEPGLQFNQWLGRIYTDVNNL